jgi:hypothetical protein
VHVRLQSKSIHGLARCYAAKEQHSGSPGASTNCVASAIHYALLARMKKLGTGAAVSRIRGSINSAADCDSALPHQQG